MTSLFKTLISSAVLVVISATAFSAMAQTPAAPTQGSRTHGEALKALDTNSDKMISRDEAKSKPRLAKNFDAIDTNKDGQLSAAEMKAYRKAHKGEHQGEHKGQAKS